MNRHEQARGTTKRKSRYYKKKRTIRNNSDSLFFLIIPDFPLHVSSFFPVVTVYSAFGSSPKEQPVISPTIFLLSFNVISTCLHSYLSNMTSVSSSPLYPFFICLSAKSDAVSASFNIYLANSNLTIYPSLLPGFIYMSVSPGLFSNSFIIYLKETSR